jgi:WW domain-containing oxidoreductase
LILTLQDPNLKNATATAMDPGNLPTSRCFQYAPMSWRATLFIAGHLVLPVAKHFTNSIQTTDATRVDLVSIAVGPARKGMRDFFCGEMSAEAFPETRDTVEQDRLWEACEKWVQLRPNESELI